MKSHRKYLINAFEKEAMARGWHDSAKNPRGLARCGYKNARQWARWMADTYFDENGLITCSILMDVIEDAAKVDQPLTQADYDYVAEEEISCW